MSKSQAELDRAVVEAAEAYEKQWSASINSHGFYNCQADALFRTVRARREEMRPHKAEFLMQISHAYHVDRPKPSCWGDLLNGQRDYWRKRLAELLSAPDEPEGGE